MVDIRNITFFEKGMECRFILMDAFCIKLVPWKINAENKYGNVSIPFFILNESSYVTSRPTGGAAAIAWLVL